MKIMRRLSTAQSGFTLIEILVVMIIMAVLLSIGGGSYRTSQIKSRDAERKSDLKQVGITLESYYNDQKQYPTSHGSNFTIMGCGAQTECAWGAQWVGEVVAGETPVYMVELPQDPRSNYRYYYWSDGAQYQLYARLENDLDIDALKDGETPQDYGISCGAANCNYGISSSNTTPAFGRTIGP